VKIHKLLRITPLEITLQTTQESNPVAHQAALDLAERRRRLAIESGRLAADLAAVARAEAMKASGIWGQVDLGSLPDPRRVREQLAEVEGEIERIDAARAEQAREAAEAAEQAAAQRREAAEATERALVEARRAYDRAQAERLRCAVAGSLADYTTAAAASDAARDAFERAQERAEGVGHE